MKADPDPLTASGTRSALAVGAGIFLSRISGFLRDVAFAFFFGTGVAADAYAAALRIPNILRNLLGEGTLSASFIPVYSGMLAREDREGSRRLAGTVLGLLVVLAAALAGLGVLLAPWITEIIVPGWTDQATRLTVRLVRILFPMAGFMILAAWCLGVLNSHRRFFLPFAAPVVWNLAQIAGLLLAWRMEWEPLIVALAWSTLAGGALQFLIQLPSARRLVGRIRLRLDVRWEAARRVVSNFGPVAVGAGVFQISSFFDVFLASFLVHGAVAALFYGQRLYYLPLSLFGISIAASALPELSREADQESFDALRRRLRDGFRSIAFTVLPSAIAFILFGDWIVATLFQRGNFTIDDTFVVHGTLAAYSIGLLAAASVKLFASGFHAMLDTRSPVRYAVVAVAVGTGLGAILMWPLYAPGLALGSALGSWVNLSLLWRGLSTRLGPVLERKDIGHLFRVLTACGLAGGAGWVVERGLESAAGPGAPMLDRLLVTAGTLAAFGVVYLASAKILRITPARSPRS